MNKENLAALFAPKTVAIIGASTDPGSVGNDIAKNLITGNFHGKVYPVNPKTDSLFNIPCYKSVSDIPEETIDLVIIVIPARLVPSVFEEAARNKKIRAAIVISSGFKETGEEGKKLEEEIIGITKRYDIAMLGPNCLGILVPKIGMNASFAASLPDPGQVALFSQSGALLTAILDLSHRNVGFSKFISTGNKATIDETELLAFLINDTETDIIAFYAESLRNAPELIKLGRLLLNRDTPKPVIALKSGTTEAGIKATNSHTGALAGSDTVYESLLRQARIFRATTLQEFLGSIRVLSQSPLPKDNRLAIVTNAGGPGVLATDAAIRAGFSLAKLSEKTATTLKNMLPPAASIGNPIDVLGDAKADRFRFALEHISTDESVDIILVIVTPQTMTEADATAEAIIETKRTSRKPFVAAFVGGTLLESGRKILEKNGIPVFSYPEEAVAALSPLAAVSHWQKTRFSPKREWDDIDPDKVRSVIARVRDEKRTMLYEHEAYEILDAYRFPLLSSRFVQSPEEAEDAAKEIGTPVAMKIVSPDIIHKTDAGGVILNITATDAQEKYKKLFDRVHENMPDARLEGAMLVEMAKGGGKEIILGLKSESEIGTVVVTGMGGIYTEAIHDVALRFVPIVKEDAEEMLRELRSYPLLAGTRGESGIDFEKLIELIGRLSKLAEDFPEITELDINPVLAYANGDDFRIVDARIAIG